MNRIHQRIAGSARATALFVNEFMQVGGCGFDATRYPGLGKR
jgi:hypothetical protein